MAGGVLSGAAGRPQVSSGEKERPESTAWPVSREFSREFSRSAITPSRAQR